MSESSEFLAELTAQGLMDPPETENERPDLPESASALPLEFEAASSYLQAGPEVSDNVRAVFDRVVRAMRPGFYTGLDYELLISYAYAQDVLNEMQKNLPDPREYMLFNNAGSPVLNPLIAGYQKQINTVSNLAVKLRITTSSRQTGGGDPSRAGQTARSTPFLDGDASVSGDPKDWRKRLLG